MDPLSGVASIIAVLQLSATVLACLNDAKAASKDRVQCAVETSNLYNLLFNLRFRLEEGGSEPWFDSVRALSVENGPLDQFKEALETLQAGMTDGGRLKKVGDALMWRFKKEEIASILGRMERLKTLVEIALQMDHFKLAQAIKEDTAFIQTHVHVIQSGVDKIQQDQDSERHRRLLDWISSTDYPAQQSDIIKRRQDGTGQWFLDAPELARLLSEPKTTLFCPGIPGAGKTMVAAIAIDYLLALAQNSSYKVAYVYCSYKSQEEQDTRSMLAALLKQLVQAQPSTVEHVEQLYTRHVNSGTRPPLEEVFGALRCVLACIPTAYIVVDALDECRDSTRRQFLAKLRDLQTGQDIRLISTSRFLPEILEEFSESIRLEVQASKEDVKRYVAGQTYRLPRCIQRDTALQNMIQEKIVDAADGMFLLARLNTDSLLDKITKKEVKSTLASFSKSSDALKYAYRDALHRIKGQLSGHYEMAKKVLSWVTLAKRPLTTAEICCALAVEAEEAELDPENIPNAEDLVSVCAGLVIIDQESDIIRLVHYTAQEYLDQIQDDFNPGAQLHIVKTCLTYLSFSTFRSGSCSTNKMFEERLKQNEFLDYAAKYWGEHAKAVEAKVASLAYAFLIQNSLFSSAVQVLVSHDKYKRYSKEYSMITALHFTAQFGLSIITEKLLLAQEKNATDVINAEDASGRTPLSLAVLHGHYGTVELLLNKGADVNAHDALAGNALQTASNRGHEQIVRLLLDKGADVNAHNGFLINPLYEASSRGHEPIVELLLNNGANVNAQGGHFGNALQVASYHGHEHIVKQLLDKGAEVNAQGGYFGNALQAGSFQRNEQIVRLLLDKGADVNAQGGNFGSALQAASYCGSEQIVKLLLNKGAGVNAQGGEYGNALYAASYAGYEATVKLLLDRGADVNIQNVYDEDEGTKDGGTKDKDTEDVVTKGEDSDEHFEEDSDEYYVKDYEDYYEEKVRGYGNALQAASVKGHEQIVKLLLNKGADINAQGGHFGSALQGAVSKGHEQVVHLLLDRGADTNV